MSNILGPPLIVESWPEGMQHVTLQGNHGRWAEFCWFGDHIIVTEYYNGFVRLKYKNPVPEFGKIPKEPKVTESKPYIKNQTIWLM